MTSAPDLVGDDKGMDLLIAHYVALKEFAANINVYRQQVVALLVTAATPVIGSLIALAAKREAIEFAKLALTYSFAFFGVTALALAAWARSMEKRQHSYRNAMATLLGRASASMREASPAQRALRHYVDKPKDDPLLDTGTALLPVALAALGLSALILAVLLHKSWLPGLADVL